MIQLVHRNFKIQSLNNLAPTSGLMELKLDANVADRPMETYSRYKYTQGPCPTGL